MEPPPSAPPEANHFQCNSRRDHFLASNSHQHCSRSSEAADQIFIELFQVRYLGMGWSMKKIWSNRKGEEVTGIKMANKPALAVSQGAATNLSLECLDTSFHTWLSEVTDTIYWMFSPRDGFCACTEDARCPLGHECPLRCPARLHPMLPAGCCVGQAPCCCCKGPFALCASRYQTRVPPPLPLRQPELWKTKGGRSAIQTSAFRKHCAVTKQSEKLVF